MEKQVDMSISDGWEKHLLGAREQHPEQADQSVSDARLPMPTNQADCTISDSREQRAPAMPTNQADFTMSDAREQRTPAISARQTDILISNARCAMPARGVLPDSSESGKHVDSFEVRQQAFQQKDKLLSEQIKRDEAALQAGLDVASAPTTFTLV